MTIYTDGPMLEPVDKWTASYIEQLDLVHRHQVLIQIATIVVGVLLLVSLAVWGRRLARRFIEHLKEPVCMVDPPIGRRE